MLGHVMIGAIAGFVSFCVAFLFFLPFLPSLLLYSVVGSLVTVLVPFYLSFRRPDVGSDASATRPAHCIIATGWGRDCDDHTRQDRVAGT